MIQLAGFRQKPVFLTERVNDNFSFSFYYGVKRKGLLGDAG